MCNKFKPKEYRPFKIMKKFGDKAYFVNFSRDMAMSKIFSVTDLYETRE